MNKRLILAALGVALVVFGAAIRFTPKTTAASTAAKKGQEQQSGAGKSRLVNGEILVRFRKGTPIARATERAGAKSELDLSDGGRQVRLQVERLDAGDELVPGLRFARVTAGDTNSAIQLLNQRADVIYAEPNARRVRQATPNDPLYPGMWNLKNTSSPGTGVVGVDIKAEQAWDVTKGSRNVVVAVIDEGVDVVHQDLAANIWRNPAEIAGNGIDDDGNGFVDDINGYDFFHNDASVYDGPGNNPDGSIIDGHGTHVAGTIGALGNNGIGVVGVNWEVSIMSLKFLGPDGGTSADSIRALSYTKMMRDLWISSGGTKGANVRITNNSYGGLQFSQAEQDAIQSIATSGILFVAAAGNESTNNHLIPSYPASYDVASVISVASIDRFDRLSTFSNYGWSNVHIAAPGTNILSTIPGNNYGINSGTSMASPHVAGVAALVLAQHPEFSVSRLRASVIFGGTATSALSSVVETGSRLNAFGSLQNANDNDVTQPGPINNLQVTSITGRTVTFTWTSPGDDGAVGRAALDEMRFVDQTTSKPYMVGTTLPLAGGNAQAASVNIPYGHTDGTLALTVIDNAGNSSTASVSVHVDADAANPYEITESAAEPLSTGGTALNPNADDLIDDFTLPFTFPFYEGNIESVFASGPTSSVFYSTNGTLYFARSAVPLHDAVSLPPFLAGWRMIAGLWDDLDLRTSRRADAGIFVVQPNANTVIFRWQGVPCNEDFSTGICQGGDPVNFEIELRSDGTIIKRYGSGNNNLFPVVGISPGERDPYLISSHTASGPTPVSLNNAATITYRLRNPPKVADVKVTGTVSPRPTLLGTDATVRLTVTNNGPNPAAGVRLSGSLPAQLTVISCTPSAGQCWAEQGGSETRINAELGTINANQSVTVDVLVNVTTATTTTRFFDLHTNWSVSSFTFDSNSSTSSNSADLLVSGINPNPNPLTGTAAIAAGYEHSYAIMPDGSLLGWGNNSESQLGDWPFNQRELPGIINGITDVVQVDGGVVHSLARTSDGRVWAWGNNGAGQLGDGTLSTKKSTPQVVSGLTGILSTAAGRAHNLALRPNGTVVAWGENVFGQLGDGTTTQRLSPIEVVGLTGVIAISAGDSHSLALKNDGTVWAWGRNDIGLVGDGTQVNRPSPVQVVGLSGIVKISAGARMSLALDNSGKVWSWGENFMGQLGDGTTIGRITPIQVNSLSNITDVAAGFEHSVALMNDGTVWTWGRNFEGQLGQLVTDMSKTTPGKVVWLTGVTSIAAGERFTLARYSGGKVAAWGSNNSRQLGSSDSSNYPYDVTAVPPPPPPPTIQFSNANYGGSELTNVISIEIQRTGNVVPAVSVDFVTSDLAGANACNVVSGKASSRCDYLTTIGTVTFAPGEISKFVQIPIVNDVYSEGDETFTITLSNATGGTLGTTSAATITINDGGPENTPNPIDQAQFFVRQHYVDFLNRFADSSGESFWTNEITSCGAVQSCIDVKRINVSAAFFLSIESQETGYLVYRTYKAGFGNLPGAPVPVVLNDYLRDTRAIGLNVQVGIGNWQSQLETNKVAYMQSFVQRPAFVAAFPAALTAEQFVDQLNTNAGGVISPAEKADLVALLGSTPADVAKRAQVLRQVAEDGDLKTAEFNRAFVLMQYFGYLRRNPNDLPNTNFDGFNFWLGKLNDFHGNFADAEMVKAFIVSGEYRQRFGP